MHSPDLWDRCPPQPLIKPQVRTSAGGKILQRTMRTAAQPWAMGDAPPSGRGLDAGHELGSYQKPALTWETTHGRSRGERGATRVLHQHTALSMITSRTRRMSAREYLRIFVKITRWCRCVNICGAEVVGQFHVKSLVIGAVYRPYTQC